MYNRKEQKQEAKTLIRGHQRFFFILFIPFLLIEIVYSVLGNQASFDSTVTSGTIKINSLDVLINSLASVIFSILAAIFLMGAIYTVFNVLRGKDDFQRPLRKSLSFIDNQRLFWGTVGTWILRAIFLSLWSLLSIPGIVLVALMPNPFGITIAIFEFIAVFVWIVIKSFAYSQALWIYRDGQLGDQPVGIYDAIKTSEDIMNGYKSDYFVLQLSFIGWTILVAITYGIVGLYFFPYYYTTQVKFYEFIKEQYNKNQTVLDAE